MFYLLFRLLSLTSQNKLREGNYHGLSLIAAIDVIIVNLVVMPFIAVVAVTVSVVVVVAVAVAVAVGCRSTCNCGCNCKDGRINRNDYKLCFPANLYGRTKQSCCPKNGRVIKKQGAVDKLSLR